MTLGCLASQSCTELGQAQPQLVIFLYLAPKLGFSIEKNVFRVGFSLHIVFP